jgi:hypothetical protein
MPSASGFHDSGTPVVGLSAATCLRTVRLPGHLAVYEVFLTVHRLVRCPPR